MSSIKAVVYDINGDTMKEIIKDTSGKSLSLSLASLQTEVNHYLSELIAGAGNEEGDGEIEEFLNSDEGSDEELILKFPPSIKKRSEQDMGFNKKLKL